MQRNLSIKTIEYITHEFAQKNMTGNEPIPDFYTRYPNILESCVVIPFQKFNKRDLYPGLTKKAAVLFYCLIKNHPFQNGNKRIAVTTLLIFLYLNNKWIQVDNKDLYNFAVWIAESPASLKQSVINAIESFIKKNIIKINDNKGKISKSDYSHYNKKLTQTEIQEMFNSYNC